MPTCCVKQCGARKTSNQHTLTFHRFPSNEILKRKWLEIIGMDNINPRPKTKYVCSMHFTETSFNRTLDVVRLRDGTLPSSSLLPCQIRPQSTLELSVDSQSTSSVIIADKASILVLQETQNIQRSTAPMYEGLQEDNEPVSDEIGLHDRQSSSTSTVPGNILQIQKQKNCQLRSKCAAFKKKIRSLKEKVRRRDKTIALFLNIIKDLQNKNLVKIKKQ